MQSVALFYYTALIIMISIMTSAVCLSAFIVTHQRSYLFGTTGFLFYFLDVLLVFQDDFLLHQNAMQMTTFYFVGQPILLTLTGAGCLTSLWLYLCDKFEWKNRALQVAPCIVFIVTSLVARLLIPQGSHNLFVFFTMRSAYLLFIVVAWFVGVSRLDPLQKAYELKHRWLMLGVVVLGAAVVAENAFTMLYLDLDTTAGGLASLLPERNIAENALMIWVAVYAWVKCGRALSVSFRRPPLEPTSNVNQLINANLDRYAERHALSKRETEVLLYVLKGKDNQNIATALSLAPSTVKVHVHNILKKTVQENRQALIRDFMKFAS